MIALQAIHLQADRLPSGEFVFYGKDEGGHAVPVTVLRKLLFAWHHKSYYGTMLETVQPGFAREAIAADPYMALDYLSEPSPLLHGNIIWNQSLQVLMKAAALFRNALQEGWYMPSYEAWRSGGHGWKLLFPEPKKGELEAILHEAENEEIDYLHQWFSDSLNVLLQQEPNITAAWGALTQGNPALLPNEAHGQAAEPWLEEEEWLIVIGWKQDEVPFLTCLQLVQPDQIHDWGLRVILQDKSNTNLFVEWNGDGTPIPDNLPSHWKEHVHRKLSSDIAKCLNIWPQLESKLAPGTLLTEMSDDEAWSFMDEGSLRLVQSGISVLLPSWWEELRLLKPKLQVQIHSSTGSGNNSMLGMDQLMKFDWKVAIGQANLSEQEFKQLVEEKKRLIHIRGNWIQLNPEQLQQILSAMKQVESSKGMSLRQVLELHLLDDEGANRQDQLPSDEPVALHIHVELNKHLKSLMKKLRQTKNIPLIEAPEELNAELRHYQLEGVSWLLYLRQFGLGGCLADDMGLGKTIQFITYLLMTKREARQAPALLICPTSVIGNWQKELERFAPSLQVQLHYGSQRAKGDQFASAIQGIDLVITSYSLSHLDEEELSAVQWDSVCLDEAQNIKNAYTKQASAIRRFNARQRIALTGTPIENRLTELWSIFDFVNPGYLGSLKKFSDKFVKAIEKDNDQARTEQVQALIRPFLLRRVKKDPAIQLDLPEKNEAKTYVTLTIEQGSLYENVVRHMLERVETLTGMEKKGLILATLTKLKQICNHPTLFLKEPGQDGSADRSNKLSRMLEMIEELRDEGEKCLIFTQFVEMGNILQAAIERELHEPVQFLHGGLPKSRRDQMIARFQDQSLPTEQSCNIFILSLKAGGTGLNLTAANHVFHYDRWWNPAVENQATDRAFRIGQTRDVQVHKFVTLGTLEERIDEMIERKQGLSQQIVGSGESWVTEMSTSELRDLFALRKQWIEK